jgi:hypothetical protein
VQFAGSGTLLSGVIEIRRCSLHCRERCVALRGNRDPYMLCFVRFEQLRWRGGVEKYARFALEFSLGGSFRTIRNPQVHPGTDARG